MKPRGFQIVIWIIALGLPFIVLCIPGNSAYKFHNMYAH